MYFYILIHFGVIEYSNNDFIVYILTTNVEENKFIDLLLIAITIQIIFEKWFEMKVMAVFAPLTYLVYKIFHIKLLFSKVEEINFLGCEIGEKLSIKYGFALFMNLFFQYCLVIIFFIILCLLELYMIKYMISKIYIARCQVKDHIRKG